MTDWPKFNSFEYHDVVIQLNDFADPSLDKGLRWTEQTLFSVETPPQPYHVMCSVKECEESEFTQGSFYKSTEGRPYFTQH